MLICDTGVIYAAMNRKDAKHQPCLELLRDHAGPLILPAPVMTEVCWLLEDRIGSEAEATFVEAVYDDEFELEALTRPDVKRIAGLVRQYSDFPLGAVDASVVAIAERCDAREIATLDHRHFSAVRPRNTDAFTLLP